MEIEEFSWIYKKKSRNLDITEEGMNELRKEYDEFWEKDYETKKLLDVIFAEKRKNETVRPNPNEMYDLALIHFNGHYQVEIREHGSERVVGVNGGYGEEYFDEQEAEKLMEWLIKYCHIKEVKKELKELKLKIFSSKNNRLKVVTTSKLRFEMLTLPPNVFDEFKRNIAESVTEEMKKDMEFFELKLDFQKIWEKHKDSFFFSDELGSFVKGSSGYSKKTGTLLISLHEGKENWSRFYEYK